MRLFRMRCRKCRRTPDEIAFYRYGAQAMHDAATADEFVRINEASFNGFTRRFTCIDCASQTTGPGVLA